MCYGGSAHCNQQLSRSHHWRNNSLGAAVAFSLVLHSFNQLHKDSKGVIASNLLAERGPRILQYLLGLQPDQLPMEKTILDLRFAVDRLAKPKHGRKPAHVHCLSAFSVGLRSPQLSSTARSTTTSSEGWDTGSSAISPDMSLRRFLLNPLPTL